MGFGFLRLAAALFVLGLTTPVTAAEPIWLRDPAISPDGSRIAFRFQGQIWTVPAVGGTALPLTQAGVHANNPVWSPDGATIVFAADRYGVSNLFAASVQGGDARRLTWDSTPEIPTGFTPDGRAVLYTAGLLGDAVQTFPAPSFGEPRNQLYQVPLNGGRETMVLPNAAMNARWNADATAIVYTSAAVEQPMRQHQVSDSVRQIWRYDGPTGAHTKLTNARTESRDAVWAPDGTILFLAERSGSLNVWRMRADGTAPVQLTHFTGEAVRTLSVSANGDIAFSQAGLLWRLHAGAATPEQVSVHIGAASFPSDSQTRTADFTDFAVSPNGREVALVARGDLYIATIDGRVTRRITNTPGEERSPNFTADGRSLIYTAERDGHWQLYEQRLAESDKSFYDAAPLTEQLLRTGLDDPLFPTISPDGKQLAFVTNRDAVVVRTLADGHETEVLPKGQFFLYSDRGWWLSWSPDSQWIATLVQPTAHIDNVVVVPADGKQLARRVAPSGEEQYGGNWSLDGGVLTWLTDADNLRVPSDAITRADTQAVFTSRAARDVFRQRLRVPLNPDGTPLAAAASVSGALPTASPGPLEPDGFETRPLTLPSQPTNARFATMLPDGVSLLTIEQASAPDGSGQQLNGLVYDTRTNRRRIMFSVLPWARGPIRASKDLSHLYFLSPTGLVEVDVAKNASRVISLAVDASHNDAAVRQATFDQLWKLTQLKFYDPTFKGIDWPGLRRTMQPRLAALGDTADLAELLSEMAGALNASHTGSFVRSSVPPQEAVASLGLFYDERYAGPGMRVTEILQSGPFDTPGTALRPGDVIMTVDGADIAAQGGIRRALRGRSGQLTTIGFIHPDAATPNPVRIFETRVPVPQSVETSIYATNRWVARNRALVAEKSCGKLGYLWLPAMNGRNFRNAFSDLFGRYSDAAGLVVDERNNSGGDLHNMLVTLLSGRPYADFQPPRGGPAQTEPRDRWTRASVVIMNGASYSDGSVFPFAYRALGLGKLVGEATAGTGTAVWWVTPDLLPGLVYGIPELPMRQLDGALLENRDVAPDVPVPNDPQAWARGEDPQLMAAIETLQPRPCAP